MACQYCGAADGGPGRNCARCGRPALPPGAGQPAAAHRWRPGPLSQVPAELLAVCTLMVVAGALLLWPSIQILPPALQAIGSGGLGTSFGLLILELVLMIIAVGVGLVLLAVRLTRADRVARGLSYVLLGVFSFSILIGNDHSAGLIVVMLLCLASLAILAAAPAVRLFFTGPGAPHAGEGVSVTVARTLLAFFACATILVGIALLPAGALGAIWVVAGVAMLGIGAGVLIVSSRLARGDPTARLIVTGLMVLYAVLELVTSGRDTASILPLLLAASIVGLLWLPPDAQRHFGRAVPATPPPVASDQWSAPPASRFCVQCGSHHEDQANFCGTCGVPIAR